MSRYLDRRVGALIISQGGWTGFSTVGETALSRFNSSIGSTPVVMVKSTVSSGAPRDRLDPAGLGSETGADASSFLYLSDLGSYTTTVTFGSVRAVSRSLFVWAVSRMRKCSETESSWLMANLPSAMSSSSFLSPSSVAA